MGHVLVQEIGTLRGYPYVQDVAGINSFVLLCSLSEVLDCVRARVDQPMRSCRVYSVCESLSTDVSVLGQLVAAFLGPTSFWLLRMDHIHLSRLKGYPEVLNPKLKPVPSKPRGLGHQT